MDRMLQGMERTLQFMKRVLKFMDWRHLVGMEAGDVTELLWL